MNAGDYVRTEDGIKKVLKYTYNEKYENGHCVWFDNKDYGILFTDEEVNKMKPSKNLIDLIEVGDIIRGKDNHLFEIYAVGSDCVYINNLEEFILVNEIKSIVTKEQFESMEYKVED